ncbi:hypothetical protein CVD28_12555 [Bacillus sp. M6-12]|uniref:hypothetical protein n=1 Tax=Bacillus sp. M6-12 TaxID=2054166 RepID=UPI000C77439B|nr:hypothetical protein [Bacillus sp. M6-12]PLS17386.1 hypothetical protein CVD28_12555 [Bacillus sp. M6-12]
MKLLIVKSLLFAIGFILIHLSSRYLKFLHYNPRSKLLSVAGGISVAYVFIHLLPELNKHQEKLGSSELPADVFNLSDNYIYLFAMIGLAVFYGLDRMVKTSKRKHEQSGKNEKAGIFWIHILSFAVYNAVIGYLLLRGEYSKDLVSMFLYFLAISFHFISNDHSLRLLHKQTYDKVGRWLLAFSILLGWGISVAVEVNEKAMAMLFAFLAGGILLNVMKEELPEERESNFLAFFGGLVFYTVLLMAI